MTPQAKEILWNLVNAGLAGTLVFLGALSVGDINTRAIGTALIAALTIGIAQFKDYWAGEETWYKNKKGGLRLL